MWNLRRTTFGRKRVSSKDTINRMLVPLQRRGPNHEGSYFSNAIGLGHRRLSIIDLSAHANQPMNDCEV